MKTITEIIKDAYLQGGNDAQGNGLCKISAEEKALKYATEVVNKNDLLPDVNKGEAEQVCSCGKKLDEDEEFICYECLEKLQGDC